MNSEENFESSRNKAILAVMKVDREKYADLEKKYKLLQSEFNVLKKTHMGVIEDCINQKRVMRDEIKRLKLKL